MKLVRLERHVGRRPSARAAGRAAPPPRRARRRLACAAASPSRCPPRTMTQPTHGLGDVRPRARSPLAIASRMKARQRRVMNVLAKQRRRRACVAAAFERRLQPHAQRLLGDGRPMSRSPKQMTLASLCWRDSRAAVGSLDQRRAHAGDLVGGDRDADARAAHARRRARRSPSSTHALADGDARTRDSRTTRSSARRRPRRRGPTPSASLQAAT